MKVREVIGGELVAVPADAPCPRVAELMRRRRREAVAVVSEGVVVGTVAHVDLQTPLCRSGNTDESVPVADVMNSTIVYCYDEDDIQATAEAMEALKVWRFIVVDAQQKPVDVVSLRQLVAASEQRSEQQPGSHQPRP